jgi:nitroreductase
MNTGHEKNLPPMVPLDYRRPETKESLERALEFAERMNRRRTVRQFSDESVDPEIIREVIRTAGTAPSGANMQPWTFVVVTDPELKREIREGAEEEERKNYGGRMSDEWLADLAMFRTDAVKEYLEIAPALIVVFAQSYGISPDGRRLKHYYVQESVGISCGLLIAAAHNAGLATLTHTPSPMRFLSRILDRPENERPFLLIPIGYPAKDAVVPDIERKGVEEILVVR